MFKKKSESLQKKENQEKNKTFKGIANASLKGSTFDAKHLDLFLTSEYGDKPQYHQNPHELTQADSLSTIPKPQNAAISKAKAAAESLNPNIHTNIR